MAVRILEAIVEIWMDGYVHCDIKPQNVYVVDNNVYLSDYESFSERHDHDEFLESYDVRLFHAQGIDSDGNASPAASDFNVCHLLGVTLGQVVDALTIELRQRVVRGNADECGDAMDKLEVLGAADIRAV